MWRMIRTSHVIRSRCMATMTTRATTTTTSSSNNISRICCSYNTKNDGWPFFMTMAMSLILIGTRNSIMSMDTTKLQEQPQEEEEEEELIVNWSGTHSVNVKKVYEPRNKKELEEIVHQCHVQKQKIRPVGSALSPNAISFQSHGMIRLDQMDQILQVDTTHQTVTVQAGARVSQVLEALRPYQLTLPNLASIAEQQMGGFIQVGAHGTGATISSIDHYLTSLTMVTPAHGTITLTPNDGEEFQLAKVGLGTLGILTEMTIQCIPSHSLKETTICMTRQQAKQQLQQLLQTHKHVRYMWIPYTDTVVVVMNDPTTTTTTTSTSTTNNDLNKQSQNNDPLLPLKELVHKLSIQYNTTPIDTEGMGFGDLRDILLAFNPLNTQHVKTVNQAEANFWKSLSNTTQIKPSDQLLQFDCGGQVRIYTYIHTMLSIHNNSIVIYLLSFLFFFKYINYIMCVCV